MNNRDALKSIWTGFRWLVINCATATDKAAHKYPYAFIWVILIASITIGYIQVGKARAERDRCYIEKYEMQQKLDSLAIFLNQKK